MAGTQKEGMEKLVEEVMRLASELDELKTRSSAISCAAPDPEFRKFDLEVCKQEVYRRNLEVLVSIKKSGTFLNDVPKAIEAKLLEGIRALKFSL